jgi:hypothetical protein
MGTAAAVSQYPVSPKTSAAGVSAAVSGAVLYVLQQYAFRGAVPAGIESLIYASVPGLVAFAAAYLAPHQNRPSVTVAPLPQPSNVTVSPAGYPPKEEKLIIPGDPPESGHSGM